MYMARVVVLKFLKKKNSQGEKLSKATTIILLLTTELRGYSIVEN